MLLYLAARFDLRLGGVHVEYRTHAARLIQLGELFSVEVVRRFRGFAFWLLLMALFGFFAPIVFALAQGAPSELHPVAFLLDLREALTLGITLLLFLLARLLERAREIEAEMREIV
jgi:hypothetical protein